MYSVTCNASHDEKERVLQQRYTQQRSKIKIVEKKRLVDIANLSIGKNGIDIVVIRHRESRIRVSTATIQAGLPVNYE